MSWPILPWTRGGANSTYAEWLTFTGSVFPDPAPDDILPDVGFSGFSDINEATLNELTDGGFITSTNNIYSFFAVTDFEITLPAPETPVGATSYFVAQFNVFGSSLDLDSVLLSYDDLQQPLVPDGSLELTNIFRGAGEFAGQNISRLFWWEIEDAVPEDYALEFNAQTTSMSLTSVALDAFAAVSGPAADYNLDTNVDSLDYDSWVASFGQSGTSADGNGDGVVSAADYPVWRDSVTSPALAATAPAFLATSVPEPASLATMLFAASLSCPIIGRPRRVIHSHRN
ncbi:MAG: hypothetical protein AAGI08_18630 [Bacteroidota bacterium]